MMQWSGPEEQGQNFPSKPWCTSTALHNISTHNTDINFHHILFNNLCNSKFLLLARLCECLEKDEEIVGR
jgi:hypothetical protein